ncbi:MAG: cyclic 2,3-diphosphoglycerate synthase [Anaerolineae bacterium]
MGAAGRDFHNFNVYFRDNPRYRVLAFTAAQIPNIEGRTYPAELAGSAYPDGIPIHREEELIRLMAQDGVDEVVFSYSDVSHEFVMHKASVALAAGADFRLLGPDATMLYAEIPVVSVCAVRTGSGKSQTARRVASILKDLDKRVVVVRHPMPYSNLLAQKVQRFSSYEDLDRYQTTIEEREEFEPHLQYGTVVYAGVDYDQVLEQAQAEADILLWDGGNNDLPFFQPDLHIVVVDPLRPGHELRYHPGEANLRMADVVVVNKIDSAREADVALVEENVRSANPEAALVEAESMVTVENPQAIEGKRVVVVEDGPTLTHGEMGYGAGVVAARRFGAAQIVDPRPYAAGSLIETYEAYPTTGPVVPAMGYGADQIADLQATLEETPCDLILVATPIDLARLIQVDRPMERVRYELREIGAPNLEGILRERFS